MTDRKAYDFLHGLFEKGDLQSETIGLRFDGVMEVSYTTIHGFEAIGYGKSLEEAAQMALDKMNGAHSDHKLVR